MKKVMLFVLLLIPTLFWAAPPIDHSINVHVISSYFVTAPGAFSGAATVQKLNVLIDGKKYELSALAAKTGLLVFRG